MNATDKTVKETVEAMINEIGQLRKLVAIDSMPPKLQQVRQLLRELNHELEITEYYSDRANSSLANRSR